MMMDSRNSRFLPVCCVVVMVVGMFWAMLFGEASVSSVESGPCSSSSSSSSQNGLTSSHISLESFGAACFQEKDVNLRFLQPKSNSIKAFFDNEFKNMINSCNSDFGRKIDETQFSQLTLQYRTNIFSQNRLKKDRLPSLRRDIFSSSHTFILSLSSYLATRKLLFQSHQPKELDEPLLQELATNMIIGALTKYFGFEETQIKERMVEEHEYYMQLFSGKNTQEDEYEEWKNNIWSFLHTEMINSRENGRNIMLSCQALYPLQLSYDLAVGTYRELINENVISLDQSLLKEDAYVCFQLLRLYAIHWIRYETRNNIAEHVVTYWITDASFNFIHAFDTNGVVDYITKRRPAKSGKKGEGHNRKREIIKQRRARRKMELERRHIEMEKEAKRKAEIDRMANRLSSGVVHFRKNSVKRLFSRGSLAKNAKR